MGAGHPVCWKGEPIGPSSKDQDGALRLENMIKGDSSCESFSRDIGSWSLLKGPDSPGFDSSVMEGQGSKKGEGHSE